MTRHSLPEAKFLFSSAFTVSLSIIQACTWTKSDTKEGTRHFRIAVLPLKTNSSLTLVSYACSTAVINNRYLINGKLRIWDFVFLATVVDYPHHCQGNSCHPYCPSTFQQTRNPIQSWALRTSLKPRSRESHIHYQPQLQKAVKPLYKRKVI